MYDAIHWQAIPADADAVAGYVDGPLSQWPDEAWQQFSGARVLLHICTWGPRHNGDTLDIEAGDSVPADIPDWVDNALARGVVRPKLYCSVAAWPECKRYAGKRPVLWWIANPTGKPHIYPGSDATQWGWSQSDTGGDYDLSLCQPWFK